MKIKNITTSQLSNAVNPSPLRRSFVLILLMLACFALLPGTQALTPAPDGGYPGGNTAEGQAALHSLTTGGFNTAVGYLSLRSNITNSFNTAVGAGALLANTADNNTATGAAALLSNTVGQWNTANGAAALASNTMGISNTANGFHALFSNTTGSANTATGSSALLVNTGDFNTADGFSALQNNTTGQENVALGVDAGSAVTTANNVICLGHPGANVSNTCFIGNVYGTNEGGAISAVYINSNGQLGTQAPPSARRFKGEIKSMERASEAILGLKPVTFHYKNDKAGTPQFGLIAEEVAKVNPDLVVRDKNGEVYTVRYDAVNAMLLNEFLKAHRKMEEQDKRIDELTAHLKEQAAQIQNVSVQVEAGKGASRVVNNP
jgi:Chaperone of endosialidase